MRIVYYNCIVSYRFWESRILHRIFPYSTPYITLYYAIYSCILPHISQYHLDCAIGPHVWRRITTYIAALYPRLFRCISQNIAPYNSVYFITYFSILHRMSPCIASYILMVNNFWLLITWHWRIFNFVIQHKRKNYFCD